MAREQVKITVANPSPILTKSLFNNYDACINPYVGCEFGCTYCYVQFMVRDAEKPWGDFVRVREHLKDKLPKELDKGYFRLQTGKQVAKDAQGLVQIGATGKPKQQGIYQDLPIADCRVVFGTMTDPYQPAERKHRITRTALEIVTNHSNQFKKVGIFTRSPIVLDDVDLIKKLPNARVHFTVTPYPADVLRIIEPISPKTERRWAVLCELKEAGIRLHVNVSPVMPIISDGFVDEWAEELANIQPAEFFVDPMMMYSDSYASFAEAMKDRPEWPQIQAIMTDSKQFAAWKTNYEWVWTKAWQKVQHRSPNTLPIWCDHVNHVWKDMRTSTQMSKRNYNEDSKV